MPEPTSHSVAERAHPENKAFRREVRFWLRRGIVPWVSIPKKPYLKAMKYRYRWVDGFAAGKTVLDVPCGMGWGMSMISRAARRIGVDLDANSIVEARQRYGKVAEFHVGSMAELPLDDDSVDIVCCLEGIEHVPVEVGTQFLAESARVLRPDGQLLISSPHYTAGGHSGNPHHIHEYQPDELRARLERQFNIEDVHSRAVDVMTITYFHTTVKPR